MKKQIIIITGEALMALSGYLLPITWWFLLPFVAAPLIIKYGYNLKP